MIPVEKDFWALHMYTPAEVTLLIGEYALDGDF
jgi:hypothetical protein